MTLFHPGHLFVALAAKARATFFVGIKVSHGLVCVKLFANVAQNLKALLIILCVMLYAKLA